MAKTQTYNDHNGCWALIENGRFISNQKERFNGVPVCNGSTKGMVENEPTAQQPEPAEPEPVAAPESVGEGEEPENPWAFW